MELRFNRVVGGVVSRAVIVIALTCGATQKDTVDSVRQMAESGDADAQVKLMEMYETGDGVHKDHDQAIKWQQKALAQGRKDSGYRMMALEGMSSAQFMLGMFYATGIDIHVPRNDAKAVIWFRKAADQGDVTAEFSLGEMYAEGRGVPKDDGEAAAWYRKAAEKGNVQAETRLSNMYADGRGVPKDPAQAAIWLEKSKSSTGHNDATTREAAEKGSIDAQLALGMKYHTGITSPRDDMEALVWYRKAADQGNVQGQYYLAEMYANGWGTSKDADQAVALYRKAAEQGSADARSRLRAMYNDRKIVPLIDAQAGDWWRKLAEQAKAESLAFARAREAAEHGSAAAQVELGTLYLTGTGVTKDRDQAEIWFKKAAEQDYSEARCLTAAMVASDMGWKSDADNADAADRCQKAANDGGSDAQVILAVFYETGRGVPKDKSQADAWWTKAAEKGRADAQDRLGGAYMKGDGVLPADKILSIEWFARAAKQNDQQAMLQLSLQETVAKMRDEPFQLPDGLDGLTLSKLAVEYSPNKKRDFLPNLWASHANEFELQQESAKAGDAFKKAWEKMGIKDGSSFADFNPTTPVR